MYDTPNVELVPYKETWKDDFEDIKKDILHFCKDENLNVQHIGSTSIPNMAAKDIIDVQVGVENFNRFEVFVELMTRAGFEILPHILQDHAPGHEFEEFVPGWEKRFFKAKSPRRAANTHVRCIDGENFKFALLFRDFLRSNKEAARAYEQAKLRLASACCSLKDYTLIKDPVCDLIMLQAKKWAVETQWKLDADLVSTMKKVDFDSRLTIIVFTGLPGVGKSTLAEAVASKLLLPIFSVDPIESAILQSGLTRSFTTGLSAYLVAETLASEHLKLGLSVVIDAVNPVQESRDMWRKLAGKFSAKLHIIECTLEPPIHKRRIEERVRNLHGIPETTWKRVEAVREEYLPWQEDRLVLDTANPQQQLLAKALDYIRGMNSDDGKA